MNLFLFIASILFLISVYGILSSRNMVRMLISIEVMFNSVVLVILSLGNLLAFSGGAQAVPILVSIVIFAIALAVSEIVLIFSIMIGVVRFRVARDIDTEELVTKER
ncbi:MAG: NADH-quinone oxidoreductase subunit K [Desulfurococcales archaeon]|jgi:NAD(P)H-quinone oxidoreductase subunit 4L|nr:NADH-quinone oxidoreductase subunit K [Desulfurococcales archaeon]